MKLRRIPYATTLIGLLVALSAWRWLASATLGMELYADEAQYWSWSLQPDWGYYSKPPMIAWLIHAGTRMFGDGELGVRAATFLVWPLTSWVLFILTRRLYRADENPERIAFWSALIFATLPLTSIGGILITTDGPLLFFWALTLYFLVRALQDGLRRDWLLAGACAGFGLLSKYSMIFFAPSLLVYLLISPERRYWLLRPWPYVAALTALLVLSPNLIWNARHGYVSLHHTAEISQLDRAWVHWDALADFALAQFGVFGPLAALGLLIALWHWRTLLADDRSRFLAAFCVVPLAAFMALSLLSRAFANWAAFAYITGAALVALWWSSRQRPFWLYWILSVNLIIAAGGYHYRTLAETAGIELTRKTDIYKRVSGYRQLGAKVADILRRHPGSRLLADDRKSMASLLYYARPESLDGRYLNPKGLAIDDHYGLTRDIHLDPATAYVLISRYAEEPQLRQRFVDVTPIEPIHIGLYADYSLDYRAWAVRGFKGYRP